MNCLSEFDHFLRMTLKGLKQTILVELFAANSISIWFENNTIVVIFIRGSWCIQEIVSYLVLFSYQRNISSTIIRSSMLNHFSPVSQFYNFYIPWKCQKTNRKPKVFWSFQGV